MNIVLIGMRGAGKSSISRRLAVLTKRDLLSTDRLISYDNGGRTIAAIVAGQGGDWRAFREMEFAVVRKVANMNGLIIDAGGGVVVDLDKQGNEIYSERKVAALKARGRLVWLTVNIRRVATKVSRDSRRPRLSGRLSEEEVMRQRIPFYKQAADLVATTEGRQRSKLAQEILAGLKNLPARG